MFNSTVSSLKFRLQVRERLNFAKLDQVQVWGIFSLIIMIPLFEKFWPKCLKKSKISRWNGLLEHGYQEHSRK